MTAAQKVSDNTLYILVDLLQVKSTCPEGCGKEVVKQSRIAFC